MNTQLLKINILGLLIVLLILASQVAINLSMYYPNSIIRQHLYRTCTSHEAAIIQAIKDVDKGKKYVLLRGLLDITEEEEEKMIRNEKEYGFKYVSLGCVVSNPYLYSYEQIMNRAINEKANKYLFRTFDKFTLERNTSHFTHFY